VRPLASGVAIVATLLAAPTLRAESPAGGLLGWVEDAHGSPLPGAVISLFGRGVGSMGLVTLSDSTGRFSVPSLPPGSYTLRALRDGHTPAPARRVLILPNQDATFTISMSPVGDPAGHDGQDAKSAAKDSDASATRDLQWLIRHKRRSALEDRAEGAQAAETDAPPTGLLASLLPDLAGTLQVVANPNFADVADEAEPSSWSVVKLNGRIADSGRWSLGGLVAERESATWRMAGEFVFEPGGGHEVEVATGYGTRAMRPMALGTDATRLDRGVGAVSFQDHWQATDRIATTIGGRYSYAGFLERSNQLDRMFAVEFRSDENARLRSLVRSHTLLPGGDVLTVSTISSAPAVALSVLDEGLRPERILRYEVAFDQEMGDFTVEGHAFYETIHDQLVNGFSTAARLHTLSVSNGGWMGTRGMGVKVSRRFGDVLQGSMTYTYGHSWRPEAVAAQPMLAFREGDFHDLAARVETMIEGTDTRVVAFCRVNRLASPELLQGSMTNTRFDVQVSQGLPFLGAITRADWDVLVAVRNLFYEASEGGVLDEMAVAHPPKRVLGGISVRF
jgi:carboxypeptidase family protein